MIDPLLSLSFNLNSQKGTYALLLGSGISRSAGIPTGWDVTIDLIRQLAYADGSELAEGEEAAWYVAKHGKEPDYSSILEEVAPTSAAQQTLLRGYFEPTEAERDEGLKGPTAAHRAIAELVASGHVKVIVTTNFDRLLEAALEAIGIAPTVVASTDDITGMSPLAHTKCTVIKLHGDYMDLRIKNSPAALAKYDKAIDKVLDQVWDEYGLIVCGWSGDYDTALRKSIERCKSRRYPTYWVATHSGPKETAKKLIAHRSAQLITTDGADQFFTQLAEKVSALEEFNRPHPLSIAAAVASLKRYMSEERHRIQLHELLLEEARKTRDAIQDAYKDAEGKPFEAHYPILVGKLEAASERLAVLFATGSMYATATQAKSFGDAFQVVSSVSKSSGGFVAHSELRKYPLMYLAYAAGVAAMVSGSFVVLHDIAYRKAILKNSDEDGHTPPDRLYPNAAADSALWSKLVLKMKDTRAYTPISERLQVLVKPILSRYITDDDALTVYFDDFEMLWTLLQVEAQMARAAENQWAAVGSYGWRRRNSMTTSEFMKEAERAANGNKYWPPLVAGIFAGSPNRIKEVLVVAVPAMIEGARWMR